MKKLIIPIIIYISLIILIFSFDTDVIKIYAKKSLIEITSSFKIIKEDPTQSILSTDQKNFLIINKNFNQKEDVVLKLEADSFLKAGLSDSNLPTGYQLNDGYLIIPTDFGKGITTNFVAAFFQAIKNNRSSLTYHEDLDHFGLVLIDGNKIEFAKNIKTNDKDIVFVLDANTFKNKGVRIKEIDGWIFKTMIAKDGTKTDVLLKPYDLVK